MVVGFVPKALIYFYPGFVAEERKTLMDQEHQLHLVFLTSGVFGVRKELKHVFIVGDCCGIWYNLCYKPWDFKKVDFQFSQIRLTFVCFNF